MGRKRATLTGYSARQAESSGGMHGTRPLGESKNCRQSIQVIQVIPIVAIANAGTGSGRLSLDCQMVGIDREFDVGDFVPVR